MSCFKHITPDGKMEFVARFLNKEVPTGKDLLAAAQKAYQLMGANIDRNRMGGSSFSFDFTPETGSSAEDGWQSLDREDYLKILNGNVFIAKEPEVIKWDTEKYRSITEQIGLKRVMSEETMLEVEVKPLDKEGFQLVKDFFAAQAAEERAIAALNRAQAALHKARDKKRLAAKAGLVIFGSQESRKNVKLSETEIGVVKKDYEKIYGEIQKLEKGK